MEILKVKSQDSTPPLVRDEHNAKEVLLFATSHDPNAVVLAYFSSSTANPSHSCARTKSSNVDGAACSGSSYRASASIPLCESEGTYLSNTQPLLPSLKPKLVIILIHLLKLRPNDGITLAHLSWRGLNVAEILPRHRFEYGYDLVEVHLFRHRKDRRSIHALWGVGEDSANHWSNVFAAVQKWHFRGGCRTGGDGQGTVAGPSWAEVAVEFPSGFEVRAVIEIE